MKEEITAFVVLIILLGMFSYNNYCTNTKTKKISSMIEKIDNADYNEKVTLEKIKKIKDKWTEEKKPFFYFCTHDTVLEIDECMELACEYMETGDKDRAIFSLKRAKVLLKDLSQREKIRLDNIF